MPKLGNKLSGTRTRARELMVQALYQKQIAGHSTSELISQYQAQAAYKRVDQAFFDEHFEVISNTQDALESMIEGLIDRPLKQLDPIELSILLIGVYELDSCIDIPYKVVINEGVNLAKRFGSIEGHKYINACLDLAARSLRDFEIKKKN
ncbi:MAG: transcription antitermination factor NusB [Gammaproteobacteria bacterium]|nr:transcription antitermination factor NusB [Gammaproteobacteria bacterium]|tara:strand:+ start:5219 stop:5668 length:450 start_codon:yes stop_codon:yes gene_type:complete